MKLDKTQLPDTPEFNLGIQLMHEITKLGHEAYLVGGCVRDLLLGKPSSDVDIATNMPMDAIKEHFQAYSYGGGEKHGTLIVHYNGIDFELTQFRTEGTYSDSRRPDNVEFTKSFKEDTKRRDFTINAMGLDPWFNIIDYHDGYRDLKDGIIRCVGNAKDRFEEDALRTLRALRFSVRFDFSITNETSRALYEVIPNLNNISTERIFDELRKIHSYGKLYKLFMLLVMNNSVEYVFGDMDIKSESSVFRAFRLLDSNVHTMATVMAVLRYYTEYDFYERWKLSNEFKVSINYMIRVGMIVSIDYTDAYNLFHILTTGNFESACNFRYLITGVQPVINYDVVDRVLSMAKLVFEDGKKSMTLALIDVGVKPSLEFGEKLEGLLRHVSTIALHNPEFLPEDLYTFAKENHDKL